MVVQIGRLRKLGTKERHWSKKRNESVEATKKSFEQHSSLALRNKEEQMSYKASTKPDRRPEESSDTLGRSDELSGKRTAAGNVSVTMDRTADISLKTTALTDLARSYQKFATAGCFCGDWNPLGT